MATECLTLHHGGLRGGGRGWRAERCTVPESCELHLCVADNRGGFWHPDDPLAFAKWRIRADLDAIPAHVMVNISRGWDTLRRAAVVGAVGLGGTVAILGVLWGRQRRFSMKTLSGSGA
ncbi:MAG TPA: hypothetical protein VID28_23040 [Methylomirabilota bacterium]|jgi:hypothetical protein